MAAFTSRSIWFPHSQRYVRSDSGRTFFTLPQRLHFLLDGKNLSILTSLPSCLPTCKTAWQGTSRNHYPSHSSQSSGTCSWPSCPDLPQPQHHTSLPVIGSAYAGNPSSVFYFFMAERHSVLLFEVISAPFLTFGQSSLLPCQSCQCLPVVPRIPALLSGGEYSHPVHRIIDPQHLLRFSHACLVFTGFIFTEKAGVILPDGSMLTVTDFSFCPSGISLCRRIRTSPAFGSRSFPPDSRIFPLTTFVV